MGESAKDQRERLRKGLEGELLAMDYFDAYQISYFAIEQNTHTWSQSLASNNFKRPDFIIWDRQIKPRIVDVKNYTVHASSTSIRVDHTDVRSLKHHAQALGMEPLLAFVMEGRYLFFLELDKLIAPSTVGQPYSVIVEPGPSKIRDEFRPEWIPREAIVTWDRLAPSAVWLNKNAAPEPLFT
ncbi:hypothetical protein [Novosphingobium sp. KACC 22771]|uniref:hypothetical protein n=1 Tax=Novosphingobium sp. KACC 22771 TaxID=3025670 RepID=UPI002365B7AA|nr:hypothetical protein [Novosphingobium sp. KACC 22771]WDF73929.1 hypothetical protein PQ467_07820 [Novosphingobium sp. KACC 22771]